MNFSYFLIAFFKAKVVKCVDLKNSKIQKICSLEDEQIYEFQLFFNCFL